jgi:hypothetical protein
MSGSINTEVAPVVFQRNVAESPVFTVEGVTLKSVTTGAIDSGLTVTAGLSGTAGFTVSTAVAVAAPVTFEAIKTYVVVIDGDTTVLPFKAKLPRSGFIFTEPALFTVQVKIAD